jgi:sortase A
MLRIDTLRALSGFEQLLLFLGLLLLFLFAFFHMYSVVYSHTALREFWHNQVISAALAPADSSQRNSGIPDFHLWSTKPIEAYQNSLFAGVSPPLGVLKIPAISLEVPIFEGTEELTLNRGVGHIDGSSLPSMIGNIGIAGHRDGFFRRLKDVHLGDTMDLYSEKGNSRYVVDDIVIVPPEDVSVLAPRSLPTLTLVTCYPFYFVGNAPLRYIVRASMADSKDLANQGPPHSLAEERGGQDSQ